jgi:uncharacterized protein YbjT (DUF2867 family)
MKKAIIFGSSGFVGSYLLDELLNNSDYEQVTIVVRRALNINHSKLKVLIGDYHSLLDLSKDIFADEIFITLGATQRSAPDPKEYYQVDHDYPILAAEIAKEKGAKSVFVVTAVGANAKSRISYIKTKGETERDIIALDFEHTHIFRPAMILGERKDKPPLEKIMAAIWTIINPVFGVIMKNFRGIKGKNIAKAMNNAAKKQQDKVKIYHWKEMNDLLQPIDNKRQRNYTDKLVELGKEILF